MARIEDAARLWDVPEDFVRSLIKSGQLHGNDEVVLFQYLFDYKEMNDEERRKKNEGFVIRLESAARCLNVSEDFVRSLVELGQIDGNDSTVYLFSVLDYKKRDDEERRKAVDDLTRISQELDLP